MSAFQNALTQTTTTNAGGHFGKAVTAADGSYMISDLPPGDFIVRAVAQDFLSEFYDNKTAIANADEVTVLHQPVTGIDFTEEDIKNFPWPDMGARWRVEGLREQAERFRAEGYAVVLKDAFAGIFESDTLGIGNLVIHQFTARTVVTDFHQQVARKDFR